jgi:hypothetical protein
MRLALRKFDLVLSLSKDGRGHQAVLRQAQHGDGGCRHQYNRAPSPSFPRSEANSGNRPPNATGEFPAGFPLSASLGGNDEEATS